MKKIGKFDLQKEEVMAKILIVDDNTLNIQVAERVLKSYGIITESVISGFECIEKIKKLMVEEP